ncbi:MAG: chitobiase/beta-hexosaminidase C-terminal domain-containing protein, partial [Candidatus Cloacimonadaceae bacterium]
MYKYIIVIICVCLSLVACDKSTSPQEIVPAPQISPQSGTFLSAQIVTIECALADAIIHYTLDETEPNSQSPVYTSPLRIDQSTTVKAMARKKGWLNSEITTAIFVLMANPVYLSPNGGNFNTPQFVTIYSAVSDNTIHYTLDGTEPSETSPVYTQPVLLDGNTVVKAAGFKANWQPGETATADFEFEALPPEVSMASGLYYNSFDVTLNISVNGAQIRYTTDGSDPDETSALYTEPLAVNQSLTLKARALKPSWNHGQLALTEYELKVTAPTFNPLPGTFTQEQAVTIICTTPQSEIRYTTDGTDPDADSDLYINPVTISQNTTLIANAFRTGWTSGNIASGHYNLQVTAPTISLPSGSYLGPQTVTLSCSTPGAQIRYTFDNTAPTENSALYTEPLMIANTRTLTTRAFKPNWTSSVSTLANYTIVNLQTVATPVFDPPGGTYSTAQVISISCATQDAVIRYTTDNSEPNSTSIIYTSPISVFESTTFQAKGFKSGWNPSPTIAVYYNINIYHEPLILVQGGIFTMGCTNGTGDPDEVPLHPVSLSDFLISTHEVTQQEFQEVTGTNPSEFNFGPSYPVDNVSFYDAVAFCNKRSSRELYMPCYEYINYGFDPDSWPLGWNTSTHNNIICHFDYDGYRLPTEAEWEYAAKGGNLSHNYLYSGGNNLDVLGW